MAVTDVIQSHVARGSGGGYYQYVAKDTLVDGSVTFTVTGMSEIKHVFATSLSSASGLLTTSVSGNSVTVTTNTGETGDVSVLVIGY